MMQEINKETSAHIICSYASDYTLSSIDCVKNIRRDMESLFSSNVNFNSSKEHEIVSLIKEYRSGVSLESITDQIISLVDSYSSLDLNQPSPEYQTMSPNQTVFCFNSVGDIVYSYRDSTWLECDGRFLSSDDYPELYVFLCSAIWDPSWGSYQNRPPTGPCLGMRFNIPKISGAWIKSKS